MKKSFPILYKKTIINKIEKILEWSIELENHHNSINIIIKSGGLNDSKSLFWKRDIKGKNIGKTNETSSWQQGVNEIKSRINLKKREGYKSLEDLDLNINDINIIDLEHYLLSKFKKYNTNLEDNLQPMKAYQYYRSKKNWIAPDNITYDDRKYYYFKNPYVKKENKSIIIDFPCYIQPKINGIRAFIQLIDNKIKIFSKKGLEYNLPHITDWFNMNIDLFKIEENDIIFDGELYIYNMPLQEISSSVKKYNINTPNIRFICFDLAIDNLDQTQRFAILYKKLKPIIEQDLTCPIEIIRTFTISNDDKVQIKTDEFIKQGYEGSIMRSFDNFYQFGKRPMTMVKLKRIIDEEFLIIDIIPQEVNPLLGLYVCITKDGKEFKVTPKGTNSFKELLLFQKDLYINKLLTVSFYEYTEDKIPFHQIDNYIRDYE